MDLGLTDSIVLVTGGSKGIGLECARAFAREGARVAIASRNPANLQRAAELLVRDRVDDLRALWEKVRPRVRQALEKVGILSFPSLTRDECDRLTNVLDREIPDLRRRLHRELGQAPKS